MVSPITRTRLDILLVERGLVETRKKAQGIILAGLVDVNGQRADKPGTPVAQNATVEIRGKPHPYVSRGGLKLAAALENFLIDPSDRDCLDVGASTGGFTDVLLQKGANKVFAVDVGYGQLDQKLRENPRVIVLERENIRYLDPGKVTPCSLVVIDVAFISLLKVLPKVAELTASGADVVCLVKPQFEVGRADVGKGGIVRDASIRQRALDDVRKGAVALGFTAVADMVSPIKGAKGNVEFLLHLKR